MKKTISPLTPTLLSQEEQEINDRVWELRLKYNDLYSDFIDDAICELTQEDFAKNFPEFPTLVDYCNATNELSHCINNGIEPNQDLWLKIKACRDRAKEMGLESHEEY